MLQFAVVVARSLFGETALWLQESVVYVHAAIIVFAVGWTLAERPACSHRCAEIADERAGFNGVVERVGLIATAVASAFILFLSWGFVAASWRMLEGSREVGGLPGLFVLKTLMPLLVILLGTAALRRLRAVS